MNNRCRARTTRDRHGRPPVFRSGHLYAPQTFGRLDDGHMRGGGRHELSTDTRSANQSSAYTRVGGYAHVSTESVLKKNKLKKTREKTRPV